MELTMDPEMSLYKSAMDNRSAKRVDMMGYDVSFEEPLISTGFSVCHALALRDMVTGKCGLVHIFYASPEDVLYKIHWCGGDGSEYEGIAGKFGEPGNVKGFHIYHREENMMSMKDVGELLREDMFNETFSASGFKDISHIQLYPEGYEFNEPGRDIIVDPKTATVYIFPRHENAYFSLPF
jgi:hypothetical protein